VLVLYLGTFGTSVAVVAKNIRPVAPPTLNIYHYVVEYNPPVDCNIRRMALLHEHDKHIGPVYAFNGKHLYSLLMLPKEVRLKHQW